MSGFFDVALPAIQDAFPETPPKREGGGGGNEEVGVQGGLLDKYVCFGISKII